MAIITTRICDKCNKDIPKTDQYWTVGVYATVGAAPMTTVHHYDMVDNMSIGVCRTCLEGFGIHVQTKVNEPAPTLPTLEDVITDIVHRAMNN